MSIREYRVTHVTNYGKLFTGPWWAADDEGADHITEFALQGILWDVEYR